MHKLFSRQISLRQVLLYSVLIPAKLLFQLENLCIHKHSVPEPLQNMPKEAFLSIKEATFYNIAKREVDERTHKQWSLYIFYFQPAFTLFFCTEKLWHDFLSFCIQSILHHQHISHFSCGISIMLFRPPCQVIQVCVHLIPLFDRETASEESPAEGAPGADHLFSQSPCPRRNTFR